MLVLFAVPMTAVQDILFTPYLFVLFVLLPLVALLLARSGRLGRGALRRANHYARVANVLFIAVRSCVAICSWHRRALMREVAVRDEPVRQQPAE